MITSEHVMKSIMTSKIVKVRYVGMFQQNANK